MLLNALTDEPFVVECATATIGFSLMAAAGLAALVAGAVQKLHS